MIYEKELSDKIVACAFKVYNELGSGFLEKVYENAMVHELRKNGIACTNQVPLKVYYDGIVVGDYFVDVLVENKIIIELKVCEKLTNIHDAQLINYLKATKLKLGYLLNFGSKNKLEFKRLVY
jgi:GxxExxY protein